MESRRLEAVERAAEQASKNLAEQQRNAQEEKARATANRAATVSSAAATRKALQEKKAAAAKKSTADKLEAEKRAALEVNRKAVEERAAEEAGFSALAQVERQVAADKEAATEAASKQKAEGLLAERKKAREAKKAAEALHAPPQEAPVASYTWDSPGPLGLKMMIRGQDQDDPQGVKLSGFDPDAFPGDLCTIQKGMTVLLVNGVDVERGAYKTVIKAIHAILPYMDI